MHGPMNVKFNNTLETKIYYQLVAGCFDIYYTKLLHVSAICPGHFRELQVWSACTACMPYMLSTSTTLVTP